MGAACGSALPPSVATFLRRSRPVLNGRWWAIGAATGLGWSAVIVAVIWGIIAAVLAAAGRKSLRSVRGLPKTADTVKKIPDALKGNE